MRRKTGMAVAAGLVFSLLAAAPHSGGWSVLTVSDYPTHLVVGTPTTLTFRIRQHGEALERGLDARVTVRMEGRMLRSQRVDAVPTRLPGEYAATFTPDEAGRATIAVQGGPRVTDMALRPLTVVAAGAPAPQLSMEERGRDLFVAKGCVTCHVKRDDPEMSARPSVRAGPDLGGRRYDAEWLATKIADPEVNRVRFTEYALMPKLELNPAEVAALVAYVNGRVVATR